MIKIEKFNIVDIASETAEERMDYGVAMSGANLEWSESMGEGIKIGIGFVIGGILGALLLKKISNVWLSIFFSVIIIAGGLKLLI